MSGHYTTFSAFLIAILFSISPVKTLSIASNTSPTACLLLKSQFPNGTFLPNEESYTPAYNHSWSKTCVLPPSCVFEPESASQVSAGLVILRKTQTRFAVRSGGHMPVPFAASIIDGVLISMRRINTLRLSPQFKPGNKEERSVTLGTGLRWQDVYPALAKEGLAAAGGRFVDVGVGGLLLGGGVNHFGSQVGWATDQVLSFEIVLASGQVINEVTRKSHPDLFWALQGGLNNFGIVTEITVRTFSVGPVYGGLIIYNDTEFEPFVEAVANYASPTGGVTDSLSAIEPVIAFVPADGTMAGGTLIFHQCNNTSNNGVAPPPSLANFTAIKTQESAVAVWNNFAEFAMLTGAPGFGSYDFRQLYHTVTVKASSPKAVKLVKDVFQPLAMAPGPLKNIAGFTTTLNPQPISEAWLRASKASGGNALALDPNVDGPLVLIGLSSFWLHETDDEAVFDFHVKAIEAITEAAKEANLWHPFVYLNDGDPSQKPFETYGHGKSLLKLQSVSKKYDPCGVFQKLQSAVWTLF